MPVYRTYNCGFCEQTVTRANASLYCSKKCFDAKKRKGWTEDWLSNKIPMEETFSGPNNSPSAYIRKYLFESNDSKCRKCGWGEINQTTGKIPLQINHIDGDSTNNSVHNLELICPNCHALTPTWGVHGKGRKKRSAGMM